jgi:hypothetical protein
MMHDWNDYQKQLLATIGDLAKLSERAGGLKRPRYRH